MKISVIVPIYNIKDCLERCVKSIQAQTYEDMEIILVDDGSTDGTAKLADSLAVGDERTVVYHKENGGSSSARNFGISKANGEYFGFVDSDDYIEPDMYEKLAILIQNNNLLIAQTSRDEIAPDGSRLPDVVTPPLKEEMVSSQDFLKELLLHKGDCSFCTKLTSRTLFDNNMFPEGELNEDFRLLTQMLSQTDRIGILPDRGYHVYYREGSNTRRKDKNDFSRVFTDIVVNADRMEILIKDKYPELTDYVLRFALVQRLDYLLHIPIAQMNAKNDFYCDIKKYLKEHKDVIKLNPYLTDDQKKKLKLLAVNPKMVRELHYISMKLRGIK